MYSDTKRLLAYLNNGSPYAGSWFSVLPTLQMASSAVRDE